MDMAKEMNEHSFYEKEDRCRRVFEEAVLTYGGAWHLCTPGEKQPLIFKNDEDYAFAMTLVAMCAYDCPTVQIVTFEIMGNHVHFVLCGDESQVLSFFALFRRRLQRYFASIGERIDLTHFSCKEPIPIESLESMRNQICYTNRNNFVVDPRHTPFSFPYGANGYYFSPKAKQSKDQRFGELTLRKKRGMIHAREPGYPDDYIITDGYFSPMNYCRLDIGEAVFRDARHYFNKLAKGIESYKEIAAMIGDSIFYTDEELSDTLRHICKEKYGGLRPTLLGIGEKTELARTLRYDYNADNEKIRRLLNLPAAYLEQLFPTRRAPRPQISLRVRMEGP